MEKDEIIEYEGRRFARTGESRRPRLGEWFLGLLGEPIKKSMESISTREREILRELPAETPAPTGESEQDSAVSALRVLNEETVLAGLPGGDRSQTLANVRAMASLLAEAEEALVWYEEQLKNGTLCRNIERDGESDYLARMVEFVSGLKRAYNVLARIRAAKENG